MQTSAQQLTASGRGAVASLKIQGDLVRLENPNVLFAAANGKRLQDQPLNRIVFGYWGLTDREEVVVCRVEETVLELHCHGGHAAVQRILNDLQSCDVEVAASSESSVDDRVFDREMTATLTLARTLRSATIIQRQRNGLLETALIKLLQIVSPDDLKAELEKLIDRSTIGQRLANPWNVVIAGRPNVGKSSLINALVGFERSIVFDQPGTTRDIVSVETAIDGWPIALSDTAGIRTNADQLEAAGIDRAKERLSSADLQVVLLDVSQIAHPDESQLLSNCPNAIIVAHKSDLPAVNTALPSLALHVSSVTGDGVDELMGEIVKRLIPTSPDDSEAIPVTARQVNLLNESLACVNDGDLEAAGVHMTAILSE